MGVKINLPKEVTVKELKQAKIEKFSLEQELMDCVLEYANSINTTRALPDVRDGLKPVHRRILVMMNRMGLSPSSSYVKNARITGQVMGALHPHGSSYGVLARMAAPYASRYLSIDFQGNIGSTDGDNPAAERYTEGRLTSYAMAMLHGLNKNTVDFVPNYDEKEEEPTVLPARLPNILLNGTSGMGVSIASDILPHNLNEVIDAIIYMLRARVAGEEISLDGLLGFIKGPDFPSGAEMLNTVDIRKVYETGKGSVTVQAKYKIEKSPKGIEKIVFIEMPYMLDKLKLQFKIETLVKAGKLDGVASVNDLSNEKKGIRFEVEVRKGYSSQIVLNNLFKQTPLQQKFSSNMMGIVEGVPKLLNLEQILGVYIKHQIEVLTRSHQFDLDKTIKRIQVVKAILIAHANKNKVIEIITNSDSEEAVIGGLKSVFNIQESEADIIAELKLRKLNPTEESKLKIELGELEVLEKSLKDILGDENLLIDVLIGDLEGYKKTLGDKRRTKIIQPSDAPVEIKDLIEDEDCAITITKLGYIKRVPLEDYSRSRRAFKSSKLQDAVVQVVTAKTLDTLLFMTPKGYAVTIKAHQIDEVGKNAKGVHVASLLKLPSTETVIGAVSLGNIESLSKEKLAGLGILIATRQGMVKRLGFDNLINLPRKGAELIGLGEGDSVITLNSVIGNETVYMLSKNGLGIRWDISKLRVVKSKKAAGTLGMKLQDDYLVAADVLHDGSNIIILMSNGYYKLVPQDEFRVQGRAGKGVITVRTTSELGDIVSALQILPDMDQVLILLDDGTILPRNISEFILSGRGTKPKNFLKSENKTIGAAII